MRGIGIIGAWRLHLTRDGDGPGAFGKFSLTPPAPPKTQQAKSFLPQAKSYDPERTARTYAEDVLMAPCPVNAENVLTYQANSRVSTPLEADQ